MKVASKFVLSALVSATLLATSSMAAARNDGKNQDSKPVTTWGHPHNSTRLIVDLTDSATKGQGEFQFVTDANGNSSLKGGITLPVADKTSAGIASVAGAVTTLTLPNNVTCTLNIAEINFHYASDGTSTVAANYELSGRANSTSSTFSVGSCAGNVLPQVKSGDVVIITVNSADATPVLFATLTGSFK